MATRFSHARELRTIGQELDKRGIDIFELRYTKGDYSVECADPNPPFSDLIQLEFTSEHLQNLELSAAQSRTQGFKQVDFESLAEILRAIGRHLEKLDAELLRIALADADSGAARFRVEYQTRDGRRHVEEMSSHDIADLTMRMYKERSTIKRRF